MNILANIKYQFIIQIDICVPYSALRGLGFPAGSCKMAATIAMSSAPVSTLVFYSVLWSGPEVVEGHVRGLSNS